MQLEESAVLRVRLTPKGGRNALSKFEDGVLHARVSAPPADGAANRALIALLAQSLRVPRTRISFVSGESSREKCLKLSGVSTDELAARLAACFTTPADRVPNG